MRDAYHTKSVLLLWSLSSERVFIVITRLYVYSQLLAGCGWVGQLGFDDQRRKYTGCKPTLRRPLSGAIRTQVQSIHYTACDSRLHNRLDT